MKFIIVVMLAIAASAHAGIGPVVDVASSWSPVGSWGPAQVNGWGAHGLVASPWGLGHGLGHGLAHSTAWPAAAAPWGHGAWAPAAPWGHGAWASAAPWAAPNIALSQGIGHGPIVHAPAAPLIAHGHGHEAQYVASNRGSVHVAPLVGHTQSVQSTNLEPAPGTTW